MRLTLVTWNLKGSKGIDVPAVAGHLRDAGADVVVLQEVQWHQARALARALDARSHRWVFKHWPVVTWPEGMAVIGVSLPLPARGHSLSHRWRVWSHRRRVVVQGVLDAGGVIVSLFDIHLSPRSAAALRPGEVAAVLRMAAGRDGPVVAAGDFNERPGRGVHTVIAGAGLRDAWAEVNGGGEAGPLPDPGATNWRHWQPGTGEPPVQRIDYVYVSAAAAVAGTRLPDLDDPAGARFSSLSDHLPLTAMLDVGASPGEASPQG
ncbi:MAG TPA: endonuclease/exonuclease/phosphatase family protein [Acidimicrobiales bacterium]|nr:endonuclease/exonuclease/phosphatase family protein [Acidimicrobiales bacterium]